MKPMFIQLYWGTPLMFPVYVDSILRGFPPGTPLHFILDKPEDGGEALLAAELPRLKDYPVGVTVTPESCYEVGGHSLGMDLFLASDCDVLLMPQSDQAFGPSPLPLLEEILARVPDAGMIGGRDGATRSRRGTVVMFSASTSSSRGDYITWLKPGQWLTIPLLNTGPAIYTRRMVEAVGRPHPGFKVNYWTDEICYRALERGFRNVIADFDLQVEYPQGAYAATTLYDGRGNGDHALLERLTPGMRRYNWDDWQPRLIRGGP